MRTLAPIPTKENVLDLLKKALKEHQMFEYRMSEKTRKHLAVDMTSVNMIVKVAEALNPTNREKYLALAPNVGRMALLAWKVAR